MEIAIIPKWVIQYFSSDFYRQKDYNIMISSIALIVVFTFFGSTLMMSLNQIPHFCLFDKVFGIECPVCGTTRAFYELSNGNLYNALQLNRMSILIASFFLLQIPLRTVSLLGIVNSYKIRLVSKYLSRILLTLIILNWIINIYI